MNYTIIWSDFATRQLDDIYLFYERRSMSSEVAKRLIRRIILAPEILRRTPYIGPREILLANRRIEYRYLVESNYKIIYAVDETHKQIRIYDVFDTRRNPIKISDSTT